MSHIIEVVDLFSESAREEMLLAARLAVAKTVAGVKSGHELVGEEFREQRGLFVTIKKHGCLRGCMGRLETAIPLAKAIGEVAIQSAVADSRFDPVRTDELGELSYEISVLSQLKRGTFGDIDVGRHGVCLRKGRHGAVYLPQVASEEGWDREELLAQLCRKAGLAEDAWRSENAELYIFEAEVFGN